MTSQVLRKTLTLCLFVCLYSRSDAWCVWVKLNFRSSQGFFLSSSFLLWAAGFCCCGRSRPSRRGHSAREACWRRAGRQTWPKVNLWTSCLNEGSVMLPDVEMREDTCLAFVLLFWDPDEFVSCYGWDPDLWIFSFVVSKSFWTLGGCVLFSTRMWIVNSWVSYWKTWYLPLFGFPVHPPAPPILLVSPQETHFYTCQTVCVGKPLLPFWTTSTCRSSLLLIPAARFRLTPRLSLLYLRPHLVSCTAAFSLCRCGLDNELNLSCYLPLFASLFCLWHSWLLCGCRVRLAASCFKCSHSLRLSDLQQQMKSSISQFWPVSLSPLVPLHELLAVSLKAPAVKTQVSQCCS